MLLMFMIVFGAESCCIHRKLHLRQAIIAVGCCGELQIQPVGKIGVGYTWATVREIMAGPRWSCENCLVLGSA